MQRPPVLETQIYNLLVLVLMALLVALLVCAPVFAEKNAAVSSYLTQTTAAEGTLASAGAR